MKRFIDTLSCIVLFFDVAHMLIAGIAAGTGVQLTPGLGSPLNRMTVWAMLSAGALSWLTLRALTREQFVNKCPRCGAEWEA